MSLFSKKKTTPDLQGMDLAQLLFVADTQEDPVVQHQALIMAEALSPDDLSVQKKLLLLGRMHERNPKKPDLTVIKCHLLHAFEHPEKFKEAQLQEMARELVGEKRLLLAMQKAPDGQQFLSDYLLDLSREYLRIFLAADNSHIPRVFGISFKGSRARYLAPPASDLIKNVFASPFLSEQEARVVARAFYRAYFEFNQGESKQLDALLGAEICALLR